MINDGDLLRVPGLTGVGKTDRRHRTKNRSYHARTPQPNYSEFEGTQYVDRPEGRQYRIPRTTSKIVDMLGGTDPRTTRDRIMWVRLPIRRGGATIQPPQIGDRLQLYQLRTQRRAQCVVDETYFGPKAATGYIRVGQFTLAPNPAVDPSQWTPYLPGRGPRRSRNDPP